MLQTSWDRVTSWGRVEATAVIKFTKPGEPTLADLCMDAMMDADADGFGGYFLFSQTRVIKRYIGRSKQCNLGKDPKISYCLYPWTLPPFWRKNLVMKEKILFQPLPSTGHIWRLAVTN